MLEADASRISQKLWVSVCANYFTIIYPIKCPCRIFWWTTKGGWHRHIYRPFRYMCLVIPRVATLYRLGEGCISPWCMRRRKDKARDARGARRDAATWHVVATDDVLRATGPWPQQAVFVLAPLLSILLACPRGLLGYSLLSTATNHGKSVSVTRYLRAQKVKLISG